MAAKSDFPEEVGDAAGGAGRGSLGRILHRAGWGTEISEPLSTGGLGILSEGKKKPVKELQGLPGGGSVSKVFATQA